MEFITNLNLLLLFAVIGGIGFVFLLISLVVGDVFEAVGFDLDGGAAGADFGLLDSRVIAVFLTAFGGFGVIAAQSGFGAVGLRGEDVLRCGQRGIGSRRVEETMAVDRDGGRCASPGIGLVRDQRGKAGDERRDDGGAGEPCRPRRCRV